MTRKFIVCIASSRSHANRMVGHLINAGFAHNAISALFPGMRGPGAPIGDPRAKTLHSAAAKTGLGIVLGGAFAWLTGLGVLTIPKFGTLIIAGAPLATILGGGAQGGIAGALADMGIPGPDARNCEEKLKAGNILVSVTAENPVEMTTAKSIFQALRAECIITTEREFPEPLLQHP